MYHIIAMGQRNGNYELQITQITFAFFKSDFEKPIISIDWFKDWQHKGFPASSIGIKILTQLLKKTRSHPIVRVSNTEEQYK